MKFSIGTIDKLERAPFFEWELYCECGFNRKENRANAQGCDSKNINCCEQVLGITAAYLFAPLSDSNTILLIPPIILVLELFEKLILKWIND